MSLGDRVAERMKLMGLSQAELARRVGITQPSVNHLLKSGAGGSAHLHKIARVLDTTPEYLTGESDQPEIQRLGDTRLGFRGAVPDVFGHEREWLETLRQLKPREREAVLDLAKSLAGKKEPRL